MAVILLDGYWCVENWKIGSFVFGDKKEIGKEKGKGDDENPAKMLILTMKM